MARRTWGDRARAGRWWAVAAIAFAAGAGAALPACDLGTRFPVCRSNADCADDKGGAGVVCFNLRCVECRYDVDCPSGKACSSSSECVALSSSAPESEDAGAVKWDPGTWEDCAAECKDEACLQKCNERFKK